MILPCAAGGGLAYREPPESGPKLCMGMNSHRMDDDRLAFMRQIGVRHLFMWGPGAPTYSPEGRVVPRRGDPAPPQGPWVESEIRAILERVERAGLRVGTMMLHDFRDLILGRPGADAAIDRVLQSIRIAGRVGLRTVEYNFYALRAQQGYYRLPGRAGAQYLSYDYEERSAKLKPIADVGEHPAEALWKRYERFLDAVIPAAKEAGVRLAVHPNDPPAPIYRGVAQIISHLAGIERLLDYKRQPENGITLDTGVTREWGLNPVELIRRFGRRQQINHSHFRNVKTDVPGLKYREVFIEEGEVDMLEAMRAFYEVGYDRLVYPDHVPRLPDDPGGRIAWAHAVGHIQALMRAAQP